MWTGTTLQETSYRLKKSILKNERQGETIAKLKVEYNRLFRLAENGRGGAGPNSSTTDAASNKSEMKMNRETIRDLGEYFLFS